MFIVFNFDGTGNEPKDGQQRINSHGKKEDDSINNILKLHLLLGVNLHDSTTSPAHEFNQYGQSTHKEIDYLFYYQGIGTYGSWWSKLLNKSLSPEQGDVASILTTAIQDFDRVYQPGVQVLVTGFSRGAALARRFVSVLSHQSQKLAESPTPFIYLLAFDTVASIGLPNLSSSRRPNFDVVFEHGFTLSPLVKQAVHLVSLDDKRKAFQSTLMNHEPERIIELWFAGAHSDIGGGFYHDGLSDIALTFALEWLTHQSTHYGMPTFSVANLTQQQLDAACGDKLFCHIEIENIHTEQKTLGQNHQQKKRLLTDWLTRADRQCCVIENNKITSKYRPLIHHSVAMRIHCACVLVRTTKTLMQ